MIKKAVPPGNLLQSNVFREGFMNYVYFVLGWIFFLLGLIGVFVPLLPTTPFIILAAGCFSKSSDRFYNWLLNLPYMGGLLRDWNENRVIGLKPKILATVFISSAVFYVGLFSPVMIYIKGIMLIICLSVLIYIWSQKTKK